MKEQTRVLCALITAFNLAAATDVTSSIAVDENDAKRSHNSREHRKATSRTHRNSIHPHTISLLSVHHQPSSSLITPPMHITPSSLHLQSNLCHAKYKINPCSQICLPFFPFFPFFLSSLLFRKTTIPLKPATQPQKTQ